MNTIQEIHQLKAIMPLLVVEDVSRTIEFYTERLGFSIDFQQTLEGDTNPSFCILRRDGIAIMFKSILPEIKPKPNSKNHEWARWDAYIATHDPDSLFSEFKEKGVEFHRDLENDDDGLRGFEVKDNSGYILCFARRI